MHHHLRSIIGQFSALMLLVGAIGCERPEMDETDTPGQTRNQIRYQVRYRCVDESTRDSVINKFEVVYTDTTGYDVTVEISDAAYPEDNYYSTFQIQMKKTANMKTIKLHAAQKSTNTPYFDKGKGRLQGIIYVNDEVKDSQTDDGATTDPDVEKEYLTIDLSVDLTDGAPDPI